VLAELNIRAGRPARARALLAGVDPANYGEPAWTERGRRATIALAFDETAEAARLAAEGIAAFEELSSGLGRDYYRAVAADHPGVADVYHIGLLAQLRMGDPVTAFGLADRCRALSLRPPARDGDPADVRAWQAAGAVLAGVHERLAADALRSDPLTTTGNESDGLVAMLAAEDGVTAIERRLTKADTPSTIEQTLPEVQRSLAGDAALLLYHSFDQELVIWAVHRDRVVVHHRTRDHRDLIRSVRELHAACANFGGDGGRPRELAAELIEPVAGELKGIRRLYVVPGGNLMLLPFAVLPLDGVPLGERLVLSVLPAAALLTRPGAGRPVPHDLPALLVGDPAYHQLPRLPGTGVEVRGIALPNRTVLTEELATAAEFASRAPEAGIVHLATHGFVDELRPHLSWLALAGRDRVTVPDLLRLGLRADLLVLSACHTGRGRATASGDVLGLARAALAAGVRHLVVSLWPVNDESACRTMIAMYGRIAAGDDVATALHKAQAQARGLEEYRGRTRDVGEASDTAGRVNPVAHWAPFIHIGA
jgi:CHAT domain-containing protein